MQPRAIHICSAKSVCTLYGVVARPKAHQDKTPTSSEATLAQAKMSERTDPRRRKVFHRVRGKRPFWWRDVCSGLADASATARVSTLDSFAELLRAATPATKHLAAILRPRVIERCLDDAPSVGAAAVRCSSALARLELLTDDDMDFVADLIWSPRRELRVEAATFVDQHYFIESVIDLVKGQRCFRDRAAGQRRTTMLHCLSDQVASRRRVSTLVHFVKDHKTRTQQFRLTERLVDGFWGRASCLEDWRTFAALALPGEGCVADEERFMGEERLILAHFMEASARLATGNLVASRYLEEAGSAVDTLNTAVTSFVWRMPEFLVANNSEVVAFPICVQFSRHLLRHLALQVWAAGLPPGGFPGGLPPGVRGQCDGGFPSGLPPRVRRHGPGRQCRTIGVPPPDVLCGRLCVGRFGLGDAPRRLLPDQ